MDIDLPATKESADLPALQPRRGLNSKPYGEFKELHSIFLAERPMQIARLLNASSNIHRQMALCRISAFTKLKKSGYTSLFLGVE